MKLSVLQYADAEHFVISVRLTVGIPPCPRTKKVNLNLGVSFGLSMNQGVRCTMEDTTAFLADAFSVGPESTQLRAPEEPSTMTATVEVTSPKSSGTPQSASAAYFGVFDGANRLCGAASASPRKQKLAMHSPICFG